MTQTNDTMENLTTGKFDTTTGILEFKGTPVSNDFNADNFAMVNGFTVNKIDSPENTSKYGGVGFKTYAKPNKHYNDSSSRELLEVLFINNLPVMYRFC